MPISLQGGELRITEAFLKTTITSGELRITKDFLKTTITSGELGITKDFLKTTITSYDDFIYPMKISHNGNIQNS